ncbi:MAG: adenosylcobinamide-phosphate synthase CbiB [Alicyclobacillus sp.]|nr:adenosylcobinamide-phosphate synthase CbiB [Alicyclobacillus sp.]
MNAPWLAALALAWDRLLGDPAWLPHPVVAMGRWIACGERWLLRPQQPPWLQRAAGGLLAGLTALFWAALPYAGLHGLQRWPGVAWVLDALLIWTTVAWKGLADAGRAVLTAFQQGGLAAARDQVGRVVGRDTEHLGESEVVRAAVETLAENIVDGIVAPLFYACLGGAPLAWLYRAVNTLDSMVGYKNERYRDFGWASARLDDVLNYLPARMTALLLLLAARCAGLDARAGWQVLRRDARKHPSPNSGWPEAFAAGALGVQLGGWNRYRGVWSHRAELGEARRPLAVADIARTVRLVEWTAGWALVAALVAGGGVAVWRWFAG